MKNFTNPLVADGKSGGCSFVFDQFGDTIQFNIPKPLYGNLLLGQTKYAKLCQSCHPGAAQGAGLDFPQLSAALAEPSMKMTLAKKDIANLVAFLNQS
jgi:hypothetical protein